MRTPPMRQNSPVTPIPLLGPGFRGLNTELANVSDSVDEMWATALQEAVFDEFGGVSIRKGWTNLTTSAMTGTPDVNRAFEYVQDDGSTFLIAATDTKLWSSNDDGATWTDITGSVTWTVGRQWQFVNFNGKVVGGVQGERLVSWNGSGTFATITAASGSVPISSGVLLAAYGRLWAVEDGSATSAYCALLDETLWAVADGAGELDSQNAWTGGTDTIVALKAFGPNYVVFGLRHILIYVDGAGSAEGIDPTNMYVLDAVGGTGALSRDSVIEIGDGDVWFLGPIGIQSLARVINDKQNPLTDVTKWQRSLLTSLIVNEGDARESVQAVYSQRDHMALYLFPGTSGRIIMLDTKYTQEDGTPRVAEWLATGHTCLATRRDFTLLFGRTAGKIAEYSGYRDDAGGANTKYSLVVGLPWLNCGHPEALKIPKRVNFSVLGSDTLTITTRWGFDFRGLEFSEQHTNDYIPSASEWGLGEFGEAEWSGGVRTRRDFTPLSGNGHVFRMYFSIESTDVAARVSIRTLVLYTRFGRAL